MSPVPAGLRSTSQAPWRQPSLSQSCGQRPKALGRGPPARAGPGNVGRGCPDTCPEPHTNPWDLGVWRCESGTQGPGLEVGGSGPRSLREEGRSGANGLFTVPGIWGDAPALLQCPRGVGSWVPWQGHLRGQAASDVRAGTPSSDGQAPTVPLSPGRACAGAAPGQLVSVGLTHSEQVGGQGKLYFTASPAHRPMGQQQGSFRPLPLGPSQAPDSGGGHRPLPAAGRWGLREAPPRTASLLGGAPPCPLGGSGPIMSACLSGQQWSWWCSGWGGATSLGHQRCPLPTRSAMAGLGPLGQGLAAEEVEGEGAEEGGDAVLAQQVQLDELGHRPRELRLQQLHPGARGSRGLRRRQGRRLAGWPSGLRSSPTGPAWGARLPSAPPRPSLQAGRSQWWRLTHVSTPTRR